MLPSLFMGLLLAASLTALVYMIRMGKTHASSQEETVKQAKLANITHPYSEDVPHNLNTVVMDLVQEHIGTAFSNYKLSPYGPLKEFEDTIKKTCSMISEYSGDVGDKFGTTIYRITKEKTTVIVKVDWVLIHLQNRVLKQGDNVKVRFSENKQEKCIRDVIIYYLPGDNLHETVSKAASEYKYEYVETPRNQSVPIRTLYISPAGQVNYTERKDTGKHKTNEDVYYLYENVDIRVGNQMVKGPLSKVFGIILEGVANGYSLVLGGAPGTGKTQLAAYIMNRLKEEIPNLSIYDIEASLFQNPLFKSQWRNVVFPSQEEENEPDPKVKALILLDQAEAVIHSKHASVIAEITNGLDDSNKIAAVMCYNGSITTENGNDVKDSFVRPGRGIHVVIQPLSSGFALSAADYIASTQKGEVDKVLLNKIISTDTPTSPAGFATLAEVFSAVVIKNSVAGIDSKLLTALNNDTKREG